MSDPKTRTRREKVEERERAIIDTTRDMFRTQGLKEVGIAAIARRAGLAEGTVYLYFRNKQALLVAAASDFYSELTREAEAGLAGCRTTWDALAFLARLHFERVLSEWPLLVEALDPLSPSENYRQTEVFQLNRRYVEIFERLVQEGVARGEIRSDLPAPAMRDAFFGGLEHAVRSARLRPSIAAADAEVAGHLAIFRAGVGASSAVSDGPRSIDALVRDLRILTGEIEQRLGARGDTGATR